jgi:hypothetical protein
MKARKENDEQIKTYGSLPSQWRGVTGNYIGGFERLDDNTLEKEGFFDVVTPEYNRTIETLDEIYFDEAQNIYTYDVIPRTDLPSLEDARKIKIRELKNRAREKFAETDWYYIRELHSAKNNKNKKVPPQIVSERELIYDFIDTKEQEINNLELEEVLNFNTSLDESTNSEKIIPEEIIEEKAEEITEDKKEEVVAEDPQVDEEKPVEESKEEENIEEEKEEPKEEVVVEEKTEEIIEDKKEEVVAEEPPVVEDKPIEESKEEENIEEEKEEPKEEAVVEEKTEEKEESSQGPIEGESGKSEEGDQSTKSEPSNEASV